MALKFGSGNVLCSFALAAETCWYRLRGVMYSVYGIRLGHVCNCICIYSSTILLVLQYSLWKLY